MNAVILAGGLGARLNPLTDLLPKPMLSVANMPMIDYTISHLWDIGVKDFVFTLNYRPEHIIDWAIGYHGAVCRFSLEHIPLGTAGGVKAVEPLLNDVFFVLSGDIIQNINLNAMLHKHLNSKAEITMAVVESAHAQHFGVCQIDGWGSVTGFKEKPMGISHGLVNTGVYIINKSVIASLPPNTKLDFAKDVLPALVQKQTLSAFIHEGYWRDVGTLQSYYHTNFELQGNGFFPPAPNRNRSRRLSHQTTQPYNSLIASTATVEGLAMHSIVGANARVHKGAEIENCIVLEGAHVLGRHTHSIIGANFVQKIEQPFIQHTHSYGQFMF